jgi:hypothetical protein
MNDGSQLPESVAGFVLKNLDSVAELEGLLLVRSSPEEDWDVGVLARRLYITDAEANVVLTTLHRRGLMGRSGDIFRYAPASDERRAEVDAVAAAYPRFLIPITNLIHGKPRASLRDFADAFRLREEK